MQHPVSVSVPLNYQVNLSVRAEGTGILNYQWFKSDEEEVCGCGGFLSFLSDTVLCYQFIE